MTRAYVCMKISESPLGLRVRYLENVVSFRTGNITRTDNIPTYGTARIRHFNTCKQDRYRFTYKSKTTIKVKLPALSSSVR